MRKSVLLIGIFCSLFVFPVLHKPVFAQISYWCYNHPSCGGDTCWSERYVDVPWGCNEHCEQNYISEIRPCACFPYCDTPVYALKCDTSTCNSSYYYTYLASCCPSGTTDPEDPDCDYYSHYGSCGQDSCGDAGECAPSEICFWKEAVEGCDPRYTSWDCRADDDCGVNMTVLGRMILDANSNLLWDDNPTSDIIEDSGNKDCGVFPNFSGLSINYSGAESGTIDYHTECNPEPYYLKVLPLGDYTFTFTLPEGYWVNAVSNDEGSDCTASGGVVTCNFPTADVGYDIWFHITNAIGRPQCGDVECSADGTQVTVNYTPFEDYRTVIRLDKEPFWFDGGWYVAGEDYWQCEEPNMTSHVFDITPGANYLLWNVQTYNDTCTTGYGASQCNLNFNCSPTISCQITANDVEFTGVADIKTALITVNDPGDGIGNYSFTINPPLVAEMLDTFGNPLSNPSTTVNPFIDMRSLLVDNSTYTVVGTMTDGVTTCPPSTANIIVNPPDSWCQILGGDAVVGDDITTANISCQIPDGSILMSEIVAGSPGLPTASGVMLNPTDPDRISSTQWKAENAPFLADIPEYDTLKKKIPDSALHSLSYSVEQSDLIDLLSDYPTGSGYRYFYYDGTLGDLTLADGSGEINLGINKVIVFANSNVNIQSKIKVTQGQGFFMLIAKGNITINTAVGGDPDGISELDGVYFTDLNFTSGTLGLNMGLDSQLHVRGVVVAGNIVQMQRSPAYADIPGDLFEFGADQNMLIPPALSRKEMTWKEVLP